MDITKTIEYFDCTKFEVGRIYYIDDDILNERERAIYLCTFVCDCDNTVVMRKIVLLQGVFDSKQMTLSNENYKHINEIQEVQFDVEYDTNFNEWRIITSIETGVNNNG